MLHVMALSVNFVPGLFKCTSADEAEGEACAEGLRLVSQWCPGPTIIESDSARIVVALQTTNDE
jgi:ribonuclease HI